MSTITNIEITQLNFAMISHLDGRFYGGSNFSWKFSGGVQVVDANSDNSFVSVTFPTSGFYFVTISAYSACEQAQVSFNHAIYVQPENNCRTSPWGGQIRKTVISPNPATPGSTIELTFDQDISPNVEIKLMKVGSEAPVVLDVSYTVLSAKKIQFSLPNYLSEGLYFTSIVDPENGTVTNERLIVVNE